jgi:hypothetical protein
MATVVLIGGRTTVAENDQFAAVSQLVEDGGRRIADSFSFASRLGTQYGQLPM